MTETKKENPSIDTKQLIQNEGEKYAQEQFLYQRITGFHNTLESTQQHFLNENTHPKLIEKIITDIKNQTPFTLIRLGDGEGSLLFWLKHKSDYPQLAQMGVNAITRLMFGGNKPAYEDFDTFSTPLQQAVDSANYIGIPTDNQINDAFSRLQDRQRIRGMTGVISVLDWVSDNPQTSLDTQNGPTYANWHIHKTLVKHAEDFIRAAGNVSLITCYPNLLKKLHDLCDVNQGRTWLIPPQSSNIGKTPDVAHFPEVSSHLEYELPLNVKKGDLYLVGAGLLGKYYCHLIKANGGMAIDMGSALDVLEGKSTRRYHKNEYITKNQIDIAK